MRLLQLISACSTIACAGLNLASPVVLVNRAKPAEVDLRANGLLAHVCDSGFNVGVQVDLRRLSDGEQLRVVLDPPLPGPPPTGGQLRLKTQVVLQQLPPGSYVATKLLLGPKNPVAFKSDTFQIIAGQILSMGHLAIRAQTNLLGQLTKLTVGTTAPDIGPDLLRIHAFRIDSLPITTKATHWVIQAP